MAQALIAYYSRAGENYVGGKIRRLEVGSAKVAAQMLHGLTGADLLRSSRRNPIPMTT